MQEATCCTMHRGIASLTRAQWKTLVASNLGWLFDGFETYALDPDRRRRAAPACSTRRSIRKSRPMPAPSSRITLLGWGIGGMIGGVLADYIGRKRMMIFAILAYSLMTGLSAFPSTGCRSPRCASWSASRSDRNGRPARR